MKGRSPLAKAGPFRSVQLRRSLEVFGVCLHTTAGSIVREARIAGVDPLEHAVGYYAAADGKEEGYAHYVIGWAGEIIQIIDENARAPHVGFSAEDRRAFLDGSWEKKVSPALAALWREKWPKVKSPAHFFPGPSPNNCYIGVEMLQLVGPEDGAPMQPGMWFTLAQHEAAAALAADIAHRYKFPPGWSRRGRLVCHEDVNPIRRPGWDPGALRVQPRFDDELVRARAEEGGPR